MLTRSPAPSGFIEPCLPTLAHAVPDGPRWAYEIEHDGFRFICRRDGDQPTPQGRAVLDALIKPPANEQGG